MCHCGSDKTRNGTFTVSAGQSLQDQIRVLMICGAFPLDEAYSKVSPCGRRRRRSTARAMTAAATITAAISAYSEYLVI